MEDDRASGLKRVNATRDAISDQLTGSMNGLGWDDEESSPGAVSGREGAWTWLMKGAADGECALMTKTFRENVTMRNFEKKYENYEN